MYPASSNWQRIQKNYYWRFLVLPLLPSFMVLLLLNQTSFDVWLEDFFFDRVAGHFPWQHSWFLETVMHDWLKKLPVLLGVYVVFRLVQSWVLHLGDWRRWLYLLLGMSLAPVLVTWLKGFTHHYCPWDLQMYGGFAPLHTLFDFSLPISGPVGQCFPGGHASGGYGLMALFFFWRKRSISKARWALFGSFLLGSTMGVTQMLRGAHFLSHNLWALWLVWLVLVVLDRVVRPDLAAVPVKRQSWCPLCTLWRRFLMVVR